MGDTRNKAITRRNFWYHPKLKIKARELRNNPTKSENKLWLQYLKQLPYKVYRQKPIGKYIVDFYLSQFKLVIEIDGETHLRDMEYDNNRTKELNKLGLTVIRFWNNEVMDGFSIVCETIDSCINKSIINPPNPLC